jgi:hypothetical protein
MPNSVKELKLFWCNQLGLDYVPALWIIKREARSSYTPDPCPTSGIDLFRFNKDKS